MAVFLGCTSTGWVVYAFCGSLSGTPEGSTGSGSGFKASQKTACNYCHLLSYRFGICLCSVNVSFKCLKFNPKWPLGHKSR